MPAKRPANPAPEWREIRYLFDVECLACGGSTATHIEQPATGLIMCPACWARVTLERNRAASRAYMAANPDMPGIVVPSE